MVVLRQGSRDIPVKLLQRLLNKRGAAPRLREDGVFGPRTHAGVVAFQQRERGLNPNGVADQTTWQRLGLSIDISHPIRLHPQPTGMTCWSAAATMIVGNMTVSTNATLAGGGLAPDAANVAAFARERGWRMHHPQTWTVQGLAGLMRQSPLWAVGGGASPTGGWLHAIVLSGLWSDGAGDGSGTLLRIHDPWPPNVGSIYGRFYRGTVDGFDFISLYILEPGPLYAHA